jgi:hypothetical protein
MAMRIDERLKAIPAVLTNLSEGAGSGCAILNRIQRHSESVLG